MDTKEQEAQSALQTLLAAPIRIQTQYIKDLSFENPRYLDIITKGEETPPQLAVNFELEAHTLGENHYEVVLNTRVEAHYSKEQADKDAKKETNTVFIMDLAYAGVFTLPQLPAEVVRPLLLIECPRLLFPFVRSIIADVTKESGFPPVLLAPVNFAELYEQGAASAELAKAAETK